MLGSVKNNRVETPMRARIAALVTIGLLAASGAQAQSWPSRPVTVVVPFAAGVTGDIVARGLVEHLSSALGHLLSVGQEDGRVGFMYQFPEPMVFQPALANGSVYVGTSGGLLICLKTGSPDADGWYAWGGNGEHNKNR